MNKCCGEKLAAFGTAIAIQIANGLNADETNILGALFTVIGDQLSLIAAAEASGNSDNSNNCNSNNNSNNNSNKNNKNKNCRS
ncbi:MAG TPA: hypothetical protein VHP54_02360 [Caproiciproducens sp.]|nr:hypothetical protein [Caproiciproducens sp.]